MQVMICYIVFVYLVVCLLLFRMSLTFKNLEHIDARCVGVLEIEAASYYSRQTLQAKVLTIGRTYISFSEAIKALLLRGLYKQA